MTAYKFTSHKQLKQLLNDVENVQKCDIGTYAGGHLNEAFLYKPPSSWASAKWTAGKDQPSISLVKRSTLPQVRKPTATETKMKETMYDFTIGTTGSVPVFPGKTTLTSAIRYKNGKSPTGGLLDDRPGSTKRHPSAASKKSIYTELQDGVLVEELKAEELMMPSSKAPSKPKRLPPTEEENEEEEESRVQFKRSLQTDSLLTFKHTFFPTHHIGVTKKDQFDKLKMMENTVIGKQDASEQNVLSGIRAVQHLERRLNDELESFNFLESGPNFHKLQVFSNIFEDLIAESPTFTYILGNIKAEYDNYISKLLDSQTPQHSKLLQEQVEQMAVRGTSRPKELQEAKLKVKRLESKAQSALEENEKLRKELLEEEEWLANAPEPVEVPRVQPHSVYHEESTAELADEIEHVKALILEKLDDLNALRTKLREEYVPLTVCTHLEQCIKETEVEVQKLLKQNEYLERSISEMEAEIKEAIQDADTSERDARRIWRKVNSRKGIPRMPGEKNGTTESDDEDDDESKWNWYIS